MNGMYVTKYTSGLKKLINLRTVTSVVLNKNMVFLYYAFSKIDGETVYGTGPIESIQAHDCMIWSTEEKANEEFERIQKCMAELK